MSGVDRRKFLAAAGSAVAALGTGFAQPLHGLHNMPDGEPSVEQAAPSTRPEKPVIGIQIDAISFLDEGTEKVLDILQEKGGVNTLFMGAFSYGTGITGRQIQGHPFPDHGVQQYQDFSKGHGGDYATPHLQYYKDTALKPLKAPDYGTVDCLELVIPAAKKRGMKVFAWSEDVFGANIPNIDKFQERDLYGKNAHTVCFNNPDTHKFWLALQEDFVRSYEIDGIMWGSERYGAFANAVESVHNRNGNDPSRVTCFCEFCQAKAKSRGVDVARAFEGFHELEKWVKSCRGGDRPNDGYYVTLWRILFRYPELLAWETMWNDSVHETYEAIYKQTKSIRPEVQVGWHVWHALSFSPWFRAQTDLAKLSAYSDYMKITVYNNLGGTRMETYISSTSKTIWGDMPIDEALQMEYRFVNLRERGYVELPYTGLSADYVYRETKRAVDDVTGSKTGIWPGLDVDIANVDLQFSRSSPPVVNECTKACFRGGGTGLVISRKYSEMRLANLAAVGDALREMKII
ncbi:MAG: twin-arginine translocation signal domain-containing protein [Acidobacteriaceae bacterium]